MSSFTHPITRGIFSIWKPNDLTSSTVTLRIRQVLHGGEAYFLGRNRWAETNANGADFGRRGERFWLKVGHGGTLDKFADGILVIGVGQDCSRLKTYQLDTDKEYEVCCEFGRMTDTLDPTGMVVKEAPWQHIQYQDLEKVLGQFRGAISQTPPIYSAKKIRGERFSDLARRQSLAAPTMSSLAHPKPISVTIKSLEILSFDPPFASLSVHCSSGTYMRSLARDIGMVLGSVAHAKSIRRIRQGSFCKESSLKEEEWNVENIRNAINNSK